MRGAGARPDYLTRHGFEVSQSAIGSSSVSRPARAMRSAASSSCSPTNTTSIFTIRRRARCSRRLGGIFSHGCVRVEQPMRLAELVMGGASEGWRPQRLASAARRDGTDGPAAARDSDLPRIFHRVRRPIRRLAGSRGHLRNRATRRGHVLANEFKIELSTSRRYRVRLGFFRVLWFPRHIDDIAALSACKAPRRGRRPGQWARRGSEGDNSFGVCVCHRRRRPAQEGADALACRPDAAEPRLCSQFHRVRGRQRRHAHDRAFQFPYQRIGLVHLHGRRRLRLGGAGEAELVPQGLAAQRTNQDGPQAVRHPLGGLPRIRVERADRRAFRLSLAEHQRDVAPTLAPCRQVFAAHGRQGGRRAFRRRRHRDDPGHHDANARGRRRILSDRRDAVGAYRQRLGPLLAQDEPNRVGAAFSGRQDGVHSRRRPADARVTSGRAPRSNRAATRCRPPARAARIRACCHGCSARAAAVPTTRRRARRAKSRRRVEAARRGAAPTQVASAAPDPLARPRATCRTARLTCSRPNRPCKARRPPLRAMRARRTKAARSACAVRSRSSSSPPCRRTSPTDLAAAQLAEAAAPTPPKRPAEFAFGALPGQAASEEGAASPDLIAALLERGRLPGVITRGVGAAPADALALAETPRPTFGTAGDARPRGRARGPHSPIRPTRTPARVAVKAASLDGSSMQPRQVSMPSADAAANADAPAVPATRRLGPAVGERFRDEAEPLRRSRL